MQFFMFLATLVVFHVATCSAQCQTNFNGNGGLACSSDVISSDPGFNGGFPSSFNPSNCGNGPIFSACDSSNFPGPVFPPGNIGSFSSDQLVPISAGIGNSFGQSFNNIPSGQFFPNNGASGCGCGCQSPSSNNIALCSNSFYPSSNLGFNTNNNFDDFNSGCNSGCNTGCNQNQYVLPTYGPCPPPLPQINAPTVVRPGRSQIVDLPAPSPPPVQVIGNTCTCTKTIVRPQVRNQVVRVPSTINYIRKSYVPVRQTVPYCANGLTGNDCGNSCNNCNSYNNCNN